MTASTSLRVLRQRGRAGLQGRDLTPEHHHERATGRDARRQGVGCQKPSGSPTRLAPCWRYRMSGVSAGDDRSSIRRDDDIRPPVVPRSLRHRMRVDQLGRSPVQHHAATRRHILGQRGGKARRAARHQAPARPARSPASTRVRAQKYSPGRLDGSSVSAATPWAELIRQPDIVLVGKREKRSPARSSARWSKARKLPVARIRPPSGWLHAPASPFASAEIRHLQNGPVRGTVVAPVQLPVGVCLRGETSELLSQVLLAIEGRKQNGHARTVSRRPLSCHRGCGLDIRDSYAKPWIATLARSYAAFFTSRFIAIIVSAICTAFRAAPFRRLSDTHQNDRPFSTVGSLRMRLTNTASSPAHSTGVT